MQLSFVTKPTQISTHQVEKSADPFYWGFAEYLAFHAGRPHYVVHRLDRDTSGAMVFAHTPDEAHTLASSFAERTAHKEYLFVSTGEVQIKTHLAEVESYDGGYRVRSHIAKVGAQFISDGHQPSNAETEIVCVRREAGFSLWRAQPITGKPHQIRLHAEALGLPILGDRAHHGAPFPRLMLHAHRLHLPGHEPFVSEPSLLFQKLEWLHDPQLCQWIAGIERRQILFASDNNVQCRRWLHTDGGELRADRLGPVVFFYWFGEENPQTQILAKIQQLTQLLGVRTWYLRWMHDRGRGVQELPLWSSHESNHEKEAPAIWVAHEDDLRFEFHAAGNSPGLFLDQRANRAWVRAHAAHKVVLNLFSYTGGFSVAAAVGKAAKVVSVDLSGNFLRWLKRNFEHNDIRPEAHEFWTQDARLFLDGAVKKQRLFDLIICDPPSFSRGAGGIFKIDKDLSQLLERLSRVLAPQGEILFSTNFEKWDRLTFREHLEKTAHKLRLQCHDTPPAEWDFEGPLTEPVLKSLRLTWSDSR